MTQLTHPHQPTTDAADKSVRPDPNKVIRAIRKRSFATIATSSPADQPHTAGVLYEAVGTTLYVNTMRASRKARNVASTPKVAVAIVIRRIPFGPPSTVQFQGTAEVLELDDPDVSALVEAGKLKTITGHGELDEPGGCFLRITPNNKLITYGLGMSLLALIRDPLDAGGVIRLDEIGG